MFFNIKNEVHINNIQAVLISNDPIMDYANSIYGKKISNTFKNNVTSRYENSTSKVREAYIYDNDTSFKKYSNNVYVDIHLIGGASLVVKSDSISIDKIVGSVGGGAAGVLTVDNGVRINFLDRNISIVNIDFRLRNGSIESGNFASNFRFFIWPFFIERYGFIFQ